MQRAPGARQGRGPTTSGGGPVGRRPQGVRGLQAPAVHELAAQTASVLTTDPKSVQLCRVSHKLILSNTQGDMTP